MSNNKLTVGILVNPVAGMGGGVGLKGTDGPKVHLEALARGAIPFAWSNMNECITTFLNHFSTLCPVNFLLCGGVMGTSEIQSSLHALNNVNAIVTYVPGTNSTGPAHTREAVLSMLAHKVDLVVFAGGDGTARDISGVLEANDAKEKMILGVPAGVKMHSSVFSNSPSAAGEVLAGYVNGATIRERREVMDIDEEAYRKGQLNVKLYALAWVPVLRGKVQCSKSVSRQGGGKNELRALGKEVAQIILQNRDTIFFLGAGTTVFSVKKILGIGGSLLGIDAVRGNKVLSEDIWGRQILELLHGGPGCTKEKAAPRKAKIILSPIGSQGFLIGRGNQQFTPGIIRKVGVDNIVVISTPTKLEGIDSLKIFTGDRALDDEFPKYFRVLIGPDRYKMVKVVVV